MFLAKVTNSEPTHCSVGHCGYSRWLSAPVWWNYDGIYHQVMAATSYNMIFCGYQPDSTDPFDLLSFTDGADIVSLLMRD